MKKRLEKLFSLTEFRWLMAGIIVTILIQISIFYVYVYLTQENNELYAVPNTSPPQLVGLSYNADFMHSTGYLTANGQVWTVFHAIDEQSFVNVRARSFETNREWLKFDDFNCQTWRLGESDWDGSCTTPKLAPDVDDMLRVGGFMPIFRVNAALYQFDQVAVWNIFDHYWMLFEVKDRNEKSIDAEGLLLDVDLDGKLDALSTVCSGYSGSPVFLVEDGQLVIQNGALLSLGEVRTHTPNFLMFQHRRTCGSEMTFSIVDPRK